MLGSFFVSVKWKFLEKRDWIKNHLELVAVTGQNQQQYNVCGNKFKLLQNELWPMVMAKLVQRVSPGTYNLHADSQEKILNAVGK